MTVDNADDVNESSSGRQSRSVIHESSDAPLCDSCKQLDLAFFDPSCPGCQEILHRETTTIPQLFAILRQWVPQTQQNIDIIIQEILHKGANINDRDRLTDMTLLHYACKSGASGVGDVKTATHVVQTLLERGADVGIRCNWTNMSALHYASYFNVAPVVELLLQANNGEDKDARCSDFENGTSLHIAATNLCLDTINVLLKYGCNPALRDDIGRTSLECISSEDMYEFIPDTSVLIEKLRNVLSAVTPSSPISPSLIPNLQNTSGRAVLKSMSLNFGDKVIVDVGSHVRKVGILRYCGKTAFSPGIWVGIELPDESGRNDGTVDGVAYFNCPQNYGIFVTISRVSKYVDSMDQSPMTARRSSPVRNVNHPRIDLSHVTSKIETGLYGSRCKSDGELCIGDRVFTARKKGTLRFSGQTEFAPGWWYGVELDEPVGKNDGSINFIRYFTCNDKRGIFVPTYRVTKLSKSKENLSEKELTSLTGLKRANSSPTSSPTGSSSPPSPNYDRRSRTRFRSLDSPTSSNARQWLIEGTTVLVNNEVGIVRFIGDVSFAAGTWLGIELRSPKGKNDGIVHSRRYFHCKPQHGLMVRPSKVTVRGINGAQLIPN